MFTPSIGIPKLFGMRESGSGPLPLLLRCLPLLSPLVGSLLQSVLGLCHFTLCFLGDASFSFVADFPPEVLIDLANLKIHLSGGR